MTKSLALDPHDLSSRGDLLPSRAGIPPRVASIIWNRNFPSLLSDPSTHDECENDALGILIEKVPSGSAETQHRRTETRELLESSAEDIAAVGPVRFADWP